MSHVFFRQQLASLVQFKFSKSLNRVKVGSIPKMNQCALHRKKIFDQAHPHPAQNEKSKMPILAKIREKKIQFLKLLPKFLTESVAEISGNMMRTSTPELSGDAISANFICYLKSYEFLKFGQKCKKLRGFRV